MKSASERTKRWREKRALEGNPVKYSKPSPEAAELKRNRQRERYREQNPVKPKPEIDPKIKWLRSVINKARHRAKQAGMPFDITITDFTIPDICPVLGFPLSFTNKTPNPRKNFNSASLDRVDNRLGYVRGNVRIISLRANALKNDATLEEIEAIYRDAISKMPRAKGFAHVNQHNIKANAKDGGNRPVLTIKRDGVTRYAREAVFQGPVRLRYDGSSLSCGARCWMEFDGALELIDEMSFREARDAA